MGDVRKEKVFVCWRRVDLRIGWEFWSLWSAVWRRCMFGGFEERNVMTATPVPPRAALHQLHSVPPTVLPLCSVMMDGLDGWRGA